ncbi:MAG: M48 family metallopeptidase [Vulcanimicrobiota bacterium]
MCVLEVAGDTVTANEKKPPTPEDARTFTFSLRQSQLTFGGTDDCKVVLSQSGHSLYAERSDLEPVLARSGLLEVSRALEGERQKVTVKRRWNRALTLSVLVGLVLLAVGLNFLLDVAVGRVVATVPVAWEEKLGELAFAGQDWKVIEDPVVVEGVQKMVDRLLAHTGSSPYKFKVKVVDDEMVNAFAAPGGQVVVMSGLLKKAESPEEVTGVLAHELQHVLHRHSIRQLADRLKWHLVMALLIGDVGSVQEAVMANAPLFLQLSFSRSMETEADTTGVELLVKSKVDPRGLRSFFERLQNQQGADPKILKIISTHPATADRIEYLNELIEANADKEFEPVEVDWKELQAHLKGDE